MTVTPLIDIKDKSAGRKDPAPLTHALLARKGQAVSASWHAETDTVRQLSESVENAAAAPSVDLDASDQSGSETGAASRVPKAWIVAGAIALIAVSATIGYVVRPSVGPVAEQRLEQRAALPAQVQPTLPKPAPKRVAQAPLTPKEQTPLEAVAPSSGGKNVAALAVASGPESAAASASGSAAAQEETKPVRKVKETSIPRPPKRAESLATVTASVEKESNSPVSALVEATDQPVAPKVPAVTLKPAVVSKADTPEKLKEPVNSISVPETPKPAALPPTSAPIALAPTSPRAERPAVQTPSKTETPVVQTASRPKPPKRSVPPVTAKSDYVVQLVSVKSQGAADREWGRLTKQFAKLFGGLEPSVQKASLAKRGTFYRLRATGFETRQQARDLCAKIKSAGQGCLVVRR